MTDADQPEPAAPPDTVPRTVARRKKSPLRFITRPFTFFARNGLRITTVRIIVQTVLFLLFVSLILLTTFANLDRLPGLRFWVSKVLEIDPLVSVATAITTHTLYKGLVWSLIILIPTLFLGRFFCDWICPYGTLHHFVGWAFGRRRTAPQRIEANRYRPIFKLKYYILIAGLILAAFGSLQIGLLDPISMFYRSFSTSVIPSLNMPLQRFFGDSDMYAGMWVIGAMFFVLVALNLVIPRFFCRVLCPLGALLGTLSRFAWWRIERDENTCNACDLCAVTCEGACEPNADLRRSECFVCFNCIEECPHGSLSFKLFPSRATEVSGPDLPRRHIILAGLAGAATFAFARGSGRATRNFSSRAIRPPGTVEELEFLERCIKCDQCLRVCPTTVIQPAGLETGVEGIWTPVMNFRMGHCQLHCTACGQVCPTGAIQRLSVEEKLGLGKFSEQGPVKLGTAPVDVGRCLPYSKNIPCVVCEEVCPTSPKAIRAERVQRLVRDGRKTVVASSVSTATLSEWPAPGQTTGRPVLFEANQWRGNDTTSYHLQVLHADGLTETHRIKGNDTDTVLIEGRFARMPQTGAEVRINLEYKVPRVDVRLCIGCGLCERECPVVGDRRAIYVTPEGETRSQGYPQRDRNRSVRLIKTV